MVNVCDGSAHMPVVCLSCLLIVRQQTELLRSVDQLSQAIYCTNLRHLSHTVLHLCQFGVQ